MSGWLGPVSESQCTQSDQGSEVSEGRLGHEEGSMS